MPVATGVITAGGSEAVKRFNPNSAYTPETGGASGQTPGYADWTALYGYYRVVAYSYEITISNLETSQAVTCYLINSNNDPSTSVNSNIAANPKTQICELSPKGGQDRKTFRGSFTIQYIVGSPSVKYDDLYSALLNASPSDVTWLGIGAQTIGGGSLALGIAYEMRLTQNTILYDYLLQIFKTVVPKEDQDVYFKQMEFIRYQRLMGRPNERFISSSANQEKEKADKARAFQYYQMIEKKAASMLTELKYLYKAESYIPFKIVY